MNICRFIFRKFIYFIEQTLIKMFYAAETPEEKNRYVFYSVFVDLLLHKYFVNQSKFFFLPY